MEQGLSRNTDPDTSHNAAERVTGKIQKLEKIVLDYLEDRKRNGFDGATTKEIAAATGYDHVTISPRMRPLARRYMVKDSCERRDRSIVWKIN